jgi:hypothetical protein
LDRKALMYFGAQFIWPLWGLSLVIDFKHQGFAISIGPLHAFLTFKPPS